VLELDLQHAMQQYLGLHERETFAFVRRSVGRAAWMIDVGAGNGELSIFFVRDSHCQIVYAFEPDPEAVRRFHRNLRFNGLIENPRLIIHNCFAGTSPAPSSLAIDDLALDPNKPGLLKIDVDGAEVDVLESARRLLTAGHPDVLVEVHSQKLENDCIGRLENLGYAVKIIDNAWWRLIVPERRPIAHNRWICGIKPH
jgi:precorrin-6B methylase 2